MAQLGAGRRHAPAGKKWSGHAEWAQPTQFKRAASGAAARAVWLSIKFAIVSVRGWVVD